MDRRTFLKAMGLGLAMPGTIFKAACGPVKVYSGGVIDISELPSLLSPAGEAILPRAITAKCTSLKFDGVEIFADQPEPGFRYYVGLHG